MDRALPKRPSRRLVGVLLLLGAMTTVAVILRAVYPEGIASALARPDVGNYKITYDIPDGWIEKPHSPFALFLYEHPEAGTLLRAAVNNVVADHNPTPELDTDGIAEHNLAMTEDNQPGWTGKRLEDIESKGGRFSAIWRERDDRTVVTAFLTRGNTTVIVSISGRGKAKSKVSGQMPMFRDFVAKIDLQPTVL